MKDLFRSDIYSLVRSKPLGVLFGVSIFMSLISFFAWHDTADGVNIIVALQRDAAALPFYLFFPAAAIVSSPIFRFGTAKNDIVYGVSRLNLYLTKLILSVVIGLISSTLYYVPAVIVASVINGFGLAYQGFWLNIFMSIGAQFLIYTAFICFAVFLMFALWHTAIAAVAYYIFVFAMAFLVPIIPVTEANIRVLRAIELYTGIDMMGHIGFLRFGEIFDIMVGTFLYIVCSTVLGIYLFYRAEIK